MTGKLRYLALGFLIIVIKNPSNGPINESEMGIDRILSLAEKSGNKSDGFDKNPKLETCLEEDLISFSELNHL